MLLRSLQRGNSQAAFIKENGAMKKVFVEADPKEKAITIRENDPSINGSATWPVPVEADHSETDNIENSLNRKSSRTKKLKDI
jgi:hypothetical protein